MNERASPKKRRTLPKEKRAALRRELYELVDEGTIDLREAVRLMRKIAGRSQAEYARMVGVSPRILIEFERGVGNPTIATLAKIYAPFGLELGLRRRRDD